ncbi:MAG: flavin-containing monooxygenase [Gemmatimonadaceae bacterium]
MIAIVGAGPAGLAAAASLQRRGIRYRLLERGDSLGHSWLNVYDSLRLHTGKHLSHLPGLRFGRAVSLFPSRGEFVAYLQRYSRHFGLAVETGSEVVRISRDEGGGWRVTLRSGVPFSASAVVMATGIMANPLTPPLAGLAGFRGAVLHSAAYRVPNAFAGRRVLVIGAGNSGGEIASELALAGARVTVAVRSGANVVPLTLAGVPIQYVAYMLRGLPRPAKEFIVARVQRAMERKRGAPVLPRPAHSALDAIPLIGFNLVDAIRRGAIALKLAAVAQVVEDGVTFSDGSRGVYDTILLATGFAPALAALGSAVRTDAKGFALRSDRVTSADEPDLYFVGHNYDATGGLSNIRRDAVLVAERIAEGA